MRFTVLCVVLCCICLLGCVSTQPQVPAVVQPLPIALPQSVQTFAVQQQDLITFVMYLLSVLFICAYTSKTGDQPQAFIQISQILYSKLKFKTKAIYRLLLYIAKKKLKGKK